MIIKIVDTQLHQSLKKLKMWPTSEKIRNNIWQRLINVLRMLGI